jgi:hypothetical protein
MPKIGPLQAAQDPDSKTPEWVVDMHDYHQKTGLYRAEDLDRVLGDPRDQVGGQTSNDVAYACGLYGNVASGD